MLHSIFIFFLLSFLNVMLFTAKTIIMYRNEKLPSSIINAIAYGFYTIIIVFMAGDMLLWLKVLIVTVSNFLGVWCSMIIMEHFKKDKLWKIECTIRKNYIKILATNLDSLKIPYSCIDISGNNIIFNIYCATQKDSLLVKGILSKINAKYFVSESKTL